MCGCDSYAGLTPLSRQGANGVLLPCVEAHCVYGPDACLERNYAGYISLTLSALAIVYLGVVFAYSLRVLVRSCRDKSFSTNVTSTVLIWTIGASFFNWAWHIADFVGFALPSAWAKVHFRSPIAIPLLSIFHVSREEMCVRVVSVRRRHHAPGSALSPRPLIVLLLTPPLSHQYTFADLYTHIDLGLELSLQRCSTLPNFRYSCSSASL